MMQGFVIFGETYRRIEAYRRDNKLDRRSTVPVADQREFTRRCRGLDYEEHYLVFLDQWWANFWTPVEALETWARKAWDEIMAESLLVNA